MKAMSDIQSVLKAEIARLARKEIRTEVASLKKSSSQYRSQIAALKRQVETLERSLKRVSRGTARAPAESVDGDEHGPARRFSAARLAKTRAKLGLSAADLGSLMGVSGQSVYKWESGEVRPRRAQIEAIAQVRSLSKREAAAKLEDLRSAAGAKKAQVRRGGSRAKVQPVAKARKRA